MLGHLNVSQDVGDRYDILEAFAGTARIARLARALGLEACALDLNYDSANNKSKANAMDMNTDAGFLFLGGMQSPLGEHPSPQSCLYELAKPRLHCLLVMHGKIGEALGILRVPCSTWVAVNRGTSWRTVFNALGNLCCMSVYKANKCTARIGAWVSCVVC